MPPDPVRRPDPVEPPSLTRRRLGLGALGLGVVGALGGAVGLGGCSLMSDPAPDGAGPLPAMDGPLEELLAVRVFPTYRASVYGDHDAVLARLGSLGVKRITHKITPSLDASTVAFTQRAYEEHGIESWLTVGQPRSPLDERQWDDVVGLLDGPLAGMVERCYGWNEPNYDRGGSPLTTQWPELTASHQEQLWARVKPLGIKIGTPQLWSGSLSTHDADLETLAPLITGTFDHIGWHLYPRGEVGTGLLERFEAIYRRLVGEFPVVCTEAGYLDAANYRGGAENLSPTQKADLVPQLVDAYYARGYGLSYFELLDDPDESATSREAGLGLVECPTFDPADWVDKPAFETFKARLARA